MRSKKVRQRQRRKSNKHLFRNANISCALFEFNSNSRNTYQETNRIFEVETSKCTNETITSSSSSTVTTLDQMNRSSSSIEQTNFFDAETDINHGNISSDLDQLYSSSSSSSSLQQTPDRLNSQNSNKRKNVENMTTNCTIEELVRENLNLKRQIVMYKRINILSKTLSRVLEVDIKTLSLGVVLWTSINRISKFMKYLI
ncbi:unnamed protein product, partial [Rotaria magnacalcarata]